MKDLRHQQLELTKAVNILIKLNEQEPSYNRHDTDFCQCHRCEAYNALCNELTIIEEEMIRRQEAGEG